MNSFTTTLVSVSMALAAGSVFAQDATKKPDATKKDMTLQECKDYMAMSKQESMKKDAPKMDDATMKQHAMCADLMKKNGTPGEPVKK